MNNIEVVLLADAPEALAELCGISLLERLLRLAQRLGFQRALVVSATPEAIRGELARPSWARENVIVEIVARPAKVAMPLLGILPQKNSASSQRWLIVPAAIYCDARLLHALTEKMAPAALVDSNPPGVARPLMEALPVTSRGKLCGPVLLTSDALSKLVSDQPLADQIRLEIDRGAIETVDAAAEPDYIVSMRRHLRPLSFPAPPRELQKTAERLVLNTAQKGTLDLPAYAHSFIENWIVSYLCRTSITPNQITFLSFAVGFGATIAYATGHVVAGVALALIFGVVDGLDGKQARVKIEMTERGEWEHELDYVIEKSWWASIPFHLWRTAQLPAAFYYFGLLFLSQIVDGFVLRQTRKRTGILLDDLTPFDRFFRLIGGRRNVYTWILAIGLFSGAFAQSYRLICLWGLITLLVHVARLLMIVRGGFAAPKASFSLSRR